MTDAFAQVAGFADVDDGSEAIPHEVDARFVRQCAEFLANGFGHGH